MSNWDAMYRAWNEERDPVLKKTKMTALVKELAPYIQKEANKWKGNLNPTVIDAEAKRNAILAIKSYKPGSSALPTHVSNYVKKVSRLVMSSGTGAIRVPEGTLESMGAFRNAWDSLESYHGREPTIAELEDELALPRYKVEQLLKKHQKEVALTSSNDDFVVSPVYNNADKIRLDVVYYDLDKIDKRIMEMAFGYGGKPVLGTGQIANRLGRSAGYVSQRKKRIESEIRKALRG